MLNERKLTERELESREVVLQSLLKNKRNLVKRYGKDAEKVMYGIATKKAKTKVEGMNKEKIKELIQQSLTKEDKKPQNKDSWADYTDIGIFYLDGFNKKHSLSDSQLEELGKKIVDQLYKGDIGKAYDAIVNRDKPDLPGKPKFTKEDNDPSGADLEGDPNEFVVGEGTDNEKEIKGKELVDYIMSNWDWSEEKTLNWLADNYGKGKQDDGPKEKSQDYIDYLKRSGRGKEADELQKNLKEGHGLDQGDIDTIQNFIDGKDIDEIPLKRVLKFIVKSNIMQDKTKDLSKGKVDERVTFDDVLDLRDDKKDLEDRIAQLYRDMEQEAEPEGGEVADRYGSELDKLEDKLYKVMSKINDYDMNESTVTESKGAANYFSDLKFNYQKAFRHLDVEEREEYKRLAKDFFSKLQVDDKVRAVGLNEETFEDEIERLEKTMYIDRRDGGRFFIHPLSKPDVRRPDKSYIAIDGNNVTSVQGYNSGPISDLADRYSLDDEDSRMTPMGQTNASGRISLLSSNILRDAIKAIQDARDAEAKSQQDYYRERGPVSGVGNMDEEVTSPEEKKLKKISKELAKASKMHQGQSDRIAQMVKEKLTKSSSVEDHIDDFKDSDAKQFKGKSLDKIKKMALASFLSKQKK